MSLFDTFWKNHPTITDDDFPCSSKDKKNFDNQCAIRMGECFERSGITTKNLPARRCWFHKNKPGHILAAEELANALEKFPISAKIVGKKGVIFFKDYYGAGNQGDHIDLWDGSRLTKFSSYWDFLFMNGGRYQKADVWFFRVIG
jgi:hypothetical protein